MNNSSSPSGTAPLLLPYPAALSPPTTISPLYCKAAVVPRNPLAAATFPDAFAKGKHIRRTHPAWENPGAGSPAAARGPASAALGPLRGGEGMQAPPEVPQSRRGRKGRASGRPPPVAAVTAPARAPPPPRCQAASPSPRVGAAAARAPHLPGPALQPARGARSAQLTFRQRRAPLHGRPAPQRRREQAAEARPAPRPRAAALGRDLRSPYLSPQAGVRLQRPRLRRLPPGRRFPAPRANHNTEQAGGRQRGGAGPSCACAGRASL